MRENERNLEAETSDPKAEIPIDRTTTTNGNPFYDHSIFYALDGPKFILDQFKGSTGKKINGHVISEILAPKYYRFNASTKLRSLRNADRKMRNNFNQIRGYSCGQLKRKFIDRVDASSDSSSCNSSNSDSSNDSSSSDSSSSDSSEESNDSNRIRRRSKENKRKRYKKSERLRKEDKKIRGKRLHISNSYTWLLDLFNRIFGCNQLIVDGYVQRIERKLFEIPKDKLDAKPKASRIRNLSAKTKKIGCRNQLFPREKIGADRSVQPVKKKRKGVIVSMSKLKELLRKAEKRKYKK